MLTIHPLALLLLIVGILSLPGCGRVYRTHYSYAAPAEMAGNQCIVQCASIREERDA